MTMAVTGRRAEAGTAGRTGSPAESKPRSRTGGIRPSELAVSTSQLALMLKTGTSLVDGLQALSRQLSGSKMGSVWGAVADDVSGGATLGNALAEYPRVFDNFYVGAVRAGEQGGDLAGVFDRLSSYIEKRIELRSSIVGAMIYPAIISLLALGAVVFVVTFVLPRFTSIFERNNVALPLPTRILMGTSDFLVSYWYLLLLAAVVVGGAVAYFLRTPAGERLWSSIVLRLPVIGATSHMIQSSTLLRTLGTLLDARVSLLDALEVTKDVCRNVYYREFVESLSSRVIQGETLSSGFEESDLMTPAIKQMVSTGENAGSMAMVLAALSDHLDADIEKRIKRLSVILEPAIIVVMGAVVGFIAISVLLPLFRLTSAARGGG